jgi:hypothetical protein
MELTPEQAMALIEVRELLRSRDMDVDTMSDEEIVGFVNRAIRWLADVVEVHDPNFSILIRLAHEQKKPESE